MPVTLVKTAWVSGNLEFRDNSGNIIATWNSGSRALIFPSGSTLDLSAAAGILSLAAGEIAAADLATNAVTAVKITAGVVSEDKLTVPTASGLNAYRIARATYDFAVNGGAISAISLTTTLPNKAIVIGGFVDVITTCTSATDAGTGAISVEGANDIVSAIAISNAANPWDAGRRAIVPKANTPESTAVKLTAARAITFTIAVEAFTAGKFVVFLLYVVSD